jgi:hypothetical protein
MRTKRFVGFMAAGICAFLCACSREQGPDYSVSSTNVVGSWVLSAVPPSAAELMPASRYGVSRMYLEKDGVARFTLVPVERIESTSPVRKSTWSLASSAGSWSLRTWQDHGRPVWQVELLTQTGGVGFTVKTNADGGFVLAYRSVADTNAAVVYQRSGP